MITQNELLRILNYNSQTGVFTWLVSTGQRAKIGSVAGSITKSGYQRIVINKKIYFSHRLALLYVYGRFPKEFIDHINHDKSDNRIINLRECNKSQNMQNVVNIKSNKSGIKGVSWCKRTNKWQAFASLNNKSVYLGRYKNINDAADAYKIFAIKHHGEFYIAKEIENETNSISIV